MSSPALTVAEDQSDVVPTTQFPQLAHLIASFDSQNPIASPQSFTLLVALSSNQVLINDPGELPRFDLSSVDRFFQSHLTTIHRLKRSKAGSATVALGDDLFATALQSWNE